MGRVRKLLTDVGGATLVELSLVFPILLTLTFGLAEFGLALWQYNAAERATVAGARYVATRGPLLTTDVPDCFVTVADGLAGTPCHEVLVGQSPSSVVCYGPSFSGCDATVAAGLVAEMQRFAPFIEADNVAVEFSPSRFGFVGLGRPIPLVTVKLGAPATPLTYDFIAIDNLIGTASQMTMPPFTAAFVAEDQNEGPGDGA